MINQEIKIALTHWFGIKIREYSGPNVLDSDIDGDWSGQTYVIFDMFRDILPLIAEDLIESYKKYMKERNTLYPTVYLFWDTLEDDVIIKLLESGAQKYVGITAPKNALL